MVSSRAKNRDGEAAVATKAIVGEKVGMTQIWDDQHRAIPVTVVRVSPVRIVQVKTAETEGYAALQVTWGFRRSSTLTKPERGHYDKATPGIDPRLVVVPTLGLGQGGGPAKAPRHLQRGITFGLGRLDLHDPDRRDAYHRHRYRPVLVIPDLGHANFFAHDRLGGHCGFSVSVLRSARHHPVPIGTAGVVDWRCAPREPTGVGSHADGPLGRT